jgi:hypothetical protein
MRVFEGGRTHLDGYALLAQQFIESTGISREDFRRFAECLFENYRRTCRTRLLRSGLVPGLLEVPELLRRLEESPADISGGISE